MHKVLLISAGLGLVLVGRLVWVMTFRDAPPLAAIAARPAPQVSESSLGSTLLVTMGFMGAGEVEPLSARTRGHVRGVFSQRATMCGTGRCW